MAFIFIEPCGIDRTVCEGCGQLLWVVVWYGIWSSVSDNITENEGYPKCRNRFPLVYIIFTELIFSKYNFIYDVRINFFSLLRMWPYKCEWQYNKLTLNFLLSCYNHSAKQRTSKQQHRKLCIYTASCCILHEELYTFMWMYFGRSTLTKIFLTNKKLFTSKCVLNWFT